MLVKLSDAALDKTTLRIVRFSIRAPIRYEEELEILCDRIGLGVNDFVYESITDFFSNNYFEECPSLFIEELATYNSRVSCTRIYPSDTEWLKRFCRFLIDEICQVTDEFEDYPYVHQIKVIYGNIVELRIYEKSPFTDEDIPF